MFNYSFNRYVVIVIITYIIRHLYVRKVDKDSCLIGTAAHLFQPASQAKRESQIKVRLTEQKKRFKYGPNKNDEIWLAKRRLTVRPEALMLVEPQFFIF
jgi:hypothetical protein